MSRTLAERLNAVGRSFRASLPERLDEISRLLASGAPDMARVHRILHDISGSAEMLGEGAIASALAPGFEIAESCARAGRIPDAADLARIEAAVARARGRLGGPNSPH